MDIYENVCPHFLKPDSCQFSETDTSILVVLFVHLLWAELCLKNSTLLAHNINSNQNTSVRAG